MAWYKYWGGHKILEKGSLWDPGDKDILHLKVFKIEALEVGISKSEGKSTCYESACYDSFFLFQGTWPNPLNSLHLPQKYTNYKTLRIMKKKKKSNTTQTSYEPHYCSYGRHQIPSRKEIKR